MPNYDQWNKEIFNTFFNKENANKNVLFCVDEDTIAEIGSKYGLSQEDSLVDFCKVVSEQILYPTRKGFKKIRLNQFNIKIINNIPSQTSLIAFYILAASKMGEDKISGDSNISKRNYYTKLAQLSEKIGYKNIDMGHNASDKDCYFKIFSDFAEFVNNRSDLYGKIKFEGLFKREGRKREDWVGVPIFQSMISQLDKAYLSNYFNTIYTKNTNVYLDKIKNSFVFGMLSNVFQNVSKNDEYKHILESYINNLYEDWLQDPCTYTIQNKKITKKPFKLSTLLYIYQKEYEDYNFYEVFENNSDANTIEITNNKVFEKHKSKNYYIRGIDKKDIDISNKQYYNSSNSSVKIRDIRNSEFILFKKSAEFEGFYIETVNVEVGDVVSIIAEPRFFKANYTEIKKVTNKDFGTMLKELNATKRILENVQVFEKSSLLNIKNTERCRFFKGLKQGNTRKYLKGAEPLVIFPEERNHANKYYIDNKTEILDNDLRKYNLAFGEHKIVYSEKEDSFQIVNTIDSNKEESINIYNYIAQFKINKINHYEENVKNIINGCFIENLEILSDDINEINSQKGIYINSIIQAIKKKQKNNNFGNKRLKDNIELRYLKEMETK